MVVSLKSMRVWEGGTLIPLVQLCAYAQKRERELHGKIDAASFFHCEVAGKKKKKDASYGQIGEKERKKEKAPLCSA